MKAILIDDEQLALEYLEKLLEKVGGIFLKGKFTFFDPNANRNLVEQIDIVFLDMEMPCIHGVDLAAELLKINPLLKIVFVTAHNNFATEAFELNAFDYLVKPVRIDRLRKTCKRIQKVHSSNIPAPKKDEGAIIVHVSGELTFELSDGTIIRPKWRTVKMKELFLYLLHKRERSILKSELTELLWPSDLTEKSYSRLYTLIYHIRKTIAPYKNNLIIESTDEGYTLNLKNATIDLIEWETKLDLFPQLHEENIDAFEKVMGLYGGAYLEKYGYIWAEAERHRLEQLYIDRALKIARYYERQKNIQQAVNWYINVCTVYPNYEGAVYSLLKALDKIGNYPLVAYYYEQYEKAVDELQIEMGKEINNWYENWEKQHLQVDGHI
ncbi:response regulator [Solibacillus silvestris]|uniref:response regulator n=1 Tax=Solibacillus silvestris TaxID=76853 RepID=UPI003F7DEB0E